MHTRKSRRVHANYGRLQAVKPNAFNAVYMLLKQLHIILLKTSTKTATKHIYMFQLNYKLLQ